MRLLASVAIAATLGIAAPAAATSLTLDFDRTAPNGGGVPTTARLLNQTGDSELFKPWGVTITTTPPPNAQPRPLALYNSDCSTSVVNAGSGLPPCTGGDEDLATGDSLGTPPQGRVLIINEHNTEEAATGGPAGPDDRAAGGTFIFDFDPFVIIEEMLLVDLDETQVGDKIDFLFTFGDGSTFDITEGEIVDLGGATRLDTIASPLCSANSGNCGENSLLRLDFGVLAGLGGLGNLTSDGVVQVARLAVRFDGISGAIGSVTYTPIPVPAALPLLGSALAAFGLLGWRRRRAAA